MSLKNSFHTELAIGILINDEESVDAKLSMLTEISLTSTSRETFEICERYRDRLCNQESAKVGKDKVHASKTRRLNGSNNGNDELNTMDGEK